MVLKKITVALALMLPLEFALAAPSHDRAAVDVEVRKIDRKKAAGPEKPTMSKADIYAAQVQRKLIEGIDTTTAYLSKTAKKFPKKSASRYEVLLRLLNLYLENAVYVASEENQRYSQKWDSWNLSGRKGPEPKLSTQKSLNLWRKVERQAEELLKEYPNSKHADQVLFNEALAQQFLNKQKESARTFSLIIQKYKNSAVAGDAYFALGDYYFDNNDFRNALGNYSSALRYRQSKRYGWALFKLGWSHFNLGQFKESLAAWKRTVSYSQSSREQGVKLKEEALRDMVFAFAELRQVDPAIAYYRANGGAKYINQFLLLLANTFVHQGQYSQAIATFKKYQSYYPLEEETPNTQKEVIGLNAEMSRYSSLWAELELLTKNYGPNSRWAKKFEKDKKLYLETQKMIKDQLLYYPKLIHSQSLKSANNEAGFNQALKGYNLFLQTFPTAREAAEVKYLMADILYFRKDYRRAGEMYLAIAVAGKEKAVVYDAKTQKAENIHQKSAKYMLDALAQDLDPEMKVLLKRKHQPDKPPMTLSPKAKNFIRGCGYYVKWYPDDKVSIKNCDVIISEIYYRTNDSKKALNYFWLVATKYPDSKEGATAVEQLIPLYKNDKKGMLAAVEKLLQIKQYKSGAIGKKLSELRWATENESIAREKDSFQRAKRYEEQARRNPKALEADALWNNAAVDYLKAGELMAALNAYTMIYTKYPKSTKAKESLLQVALLYEKMFKLKQASQIFLEFTKKHPKEKEAAGAFAKACEIQIATNHQSAISTCLSFTQQHPKDGQLIVSKLIDLTRRKKQIAKMEELITKNYVSRSGITPNDRIVAFYAIYSAYNGKGSSAQRAAAGILSEFRRSNSSVSGEALRYVGEIYFNEVGNVVESLKSQKLAGGTVDAMVASISKMSSALENIKGRYQKVLGTKDPFWGVAALYQIGTAYAHLANQLENPPGIAGAKIEDVKNQLAPQAVAVKNEARGYFDNAVKTVSKFNIYNEWAVRSVNSLAMIEGKKRTFEELVLEPDFVGAITPTEVLSVF
ncbi:MAG: tetratricopeptide repeat protein [Oligoflexales bacterium]|nr:tetratricopeptide repeat protein [Oligoflexales bacterium]